MVGTSSIGLLVEKSTKNQIIQILSEEWPLSAKQIHNILQKQYTSTASYQATHKMIKILKENQTIETDGKNYKLSKNWISNLDRFSNNLKDKYLNDKKNYVIPENFQGTIKWEFDDYSLFSVEMAKHFAKKSFVGTGELIGLGILKHAWWPLKFRFIDFNILTNMINNANDSYIVIQEDMPFDKWIVKQYSAAKMTGIRIGEKNLNLKKDLAIHGNSIIEVTYSKETNKMLDEIYSQTKDLGDLFKHYVKYSISKNPAKIEVTITKNPELAELMRTQLIEKYFGVKK